MKSRTATTTTTANLVQETTSIKNTSLSKIVVDRTRFSDVPKLLRMTALVLKCIKSLKAKVDKERFFNDMLLTAAEIKEARDAWICDGQKELEQQPNYETFKQHH